MGLYTIQIVVHFMRLLFGWLYALIVLCFLSLMSWSYAPWLVSAIFIAILYSIPTKAFCKSSLIKYLAFILYFCAIAGFVIVSFFAVSKLGKGPILFGGTKEVGVSRIWGITVAIIMTLCALAGPIELWLKKIDVRVDKFFEK